MISVALIGARDRLGSIQYTAEELVDLLDDYQPVGALRTLDVTSARNYVSAVNAALDRMCSATRKESA